MNKCVKCDKESDELSYDNYCWDCFKKTEHTPSKIISDMIELNTPISIDNIIERINTDAIFLDMDLTEEFIKKIIKDSIRAGLIIENSKGLIEWNITPKSENNAE